MRRHYDDDKNEGQTKKEKPDHLAKTNMITKAVKMIAMIHLVSVSMTCLR